MSNDKMREEFEAAFVEREHGLGRHPRLRRMATGNYEYVEASSAWWAWQASRAAIEIELPDEQPGYQYYAPDVLGAIEAAGLKVKP